MRVFFLEHGVVYCATVSFADVVLGLNVVVGYLLPPF